MPPNIEEKLDLPPASDIETETSAVEVEKEDEKIYHGRLELHVVPAVEFQQMAVFEKLLLEIPNLRLIGKGGSNYGTSWAEIELSEPMPILMILKRLSPVKEVVAHGNIIIVSLEVRHAVYGNWSLLKQAFSFQA